MSAWAWAHISSVQGDNDAGAFKARRSTSMFLRMIEIGATMPDAIWAIEATDEVSRRSSSILIYTLCFHYHHFFVDNNYIILLELKD